MLKTIAASMLVGIPSAVFLMGVYGITSQQHMLEHYQPIEATVLSIWETGASEGGYAPKVAYLYSVDGHEYTNHRVWPLDVQTNREAVSAVLARFEVGQTVEAYYDPDNPAESFLLREMLEIPYLLAAFPIAFAGLMLLDLWLKELGKKKKKKMEKGTANPAAPGEMTVAFKRKAAGVIALVWWVAAAPVWAHCLYTAGTIGWISGLAILLYYVLGIVPIRVYYRLLREEADSIVA